MNKTQLDLFIEKVKRGEQADRLIDGIREGYYIAIAVGNSEIEIKNKSHLDVIKKNLFEISQEGKQALERAKLE